MDLASDRTFNLKVCSNMDLKCELVCDRSANNAISIILHLVYIGI